MTASVMARMVSRSCAGSLLRMWICRGGGNWAQQLRGTPIILVRPNWKYPLREKWNLMNKSWRMLLKTSRPTLVRNVK